MTYKEAKELKDAGFLQRDGALIFSERMEIYDMEERRKLGCTDPTLEELIEECGDEFDNLEKRDKVFFAFGSSKDTFGMKMKPYLGGGKTMKQAVKNLWLKLHDKKSS